MSVSIDKGAPIKKRLARDQQHGRVPRRVRAWARQPWARLLMLALLLGFAFQGTRGLWSTDEGRYVDGAVQMLASGNFLVPAYSPDRINLSKPPLTYWVIAGSIAAFGYNTWAVRAPYAIAFALTVLLLYAIAERLSAERAWLPGLIYASSVLPFLSANVVNTDVLLTLFEALAAYGFVRLAFGTAESLRWNACVMWLGLGLAFLTKGPPGLILLLAVIPFVLIRNGGRGLLRVFRPLGLLVFCAVGLPWYVAVVVHDPRALHYFLYREVYQRIFTAALHRNPGPWGWARVYLPVLIVGALPWWFLVLPALRRMLTPTSAWGWLQQEPARLFVTLWFVVPGVAFCVAQSRLPLYILPLFLPLALLIAAGVPRTFDLRKPMWVALVASWIVLLLLTKGGLSTFAHPIADHREAAHELAGITRGRAYGALVFVESVDTDYKVEERTPWGLRLYLRKPVYGFAWYMDDSAQRLCRAIHADRLTATLLLVATPVAAAAQHAIAAQCPVHAISRIGVWRGRDLLWVKA